MLRKLLNMINLKWSQGFDITTALTIKQGTGSNPYLTVRTGILYFHGYMNAPDMLPNQQIVLDNLLMSDLVTQISNMGYSVTSFIAGSESALVLMETESQDMTMPSGVNVLAYTSNFHRVLYPIHRILSQQGGDVDSAIEQLMLPSASGDWLDYWCSFFKVQRLPSEDDDTLLRRTLLTISSAKSNNTAMEELVSYYVNSPTQVLDSAPNELEVRVDPMYMDSAQKIHDIIYTIKSAAVDYIVNYQSVSSENYQASFFDQHGQTFRDFNQGKYTTTITFPVYAEDYLYIPPELQLTFYMNSGTLNNPKNLLSHPSDKVIDSLSMVMKDSSGNVVQQM